MKHLTPLLLPLLEISIVPALAPTPIFEGVVATAMGSTLFLLLLALVASWIHLTANAESTVRFRPRALIFHLCAIVPFVVASLQHSSLRESRGGPATLCLTLLLGLGSILTALPLFYARKDLVRRAREHRVRTIIAGIAIVFIFAGGCLDDKFWALVAWPTGNLIILALDILRVPVSSNWGNNALYLVHPGFRVSVYAPCGGLEGVTFFWFVWSMVLLFEETPPGLSSAIGLWAAGTLYMFLLNVARIVAFLLAGVWASSHMVRNSDVAIRLFHANVGWIVYLAGIVVFFYAAMSRKQRSIS